jgi:hypothetical protein
LNIGAALPGGFREDITYYKWQLVNILEKLWAYSLGEDFFESG